MSDFFAQLLTRFIDFLRSLRPSHQISVLLWIIMLQLVVIGWLFLQLKQKDDHLKQKDEYSAALQRVSDEWIDMLKEDNNRLRQDIDLFESRLHHRIEQVRETTRTQVTNEFLRMPLDKDDNDRLREYDEQD